MATAVLINGFHGKSDKLARKQVKCFLKFFSYSFSWAFFQWFYTGKEDCGFQQFPTFGLKAWKQTFYFDFSLTYVGTGMICPHIVNISLLLGAVLSWGVMWPLIAKLKGEWFPADIPESSMKSLNGYKVFISIALLLGDGLYNFAKIMYFTLGSVHERFKHKNQTPAAGVRQNKNSGDVKYDEAFVRESIPMWFGGVGYLALGTIAVIMIPLIFHEIKWYWVIIAYLFAPSLAFCNAYGSGLTDINMAYNYGKVGLFMMAALAGKEHGVIAGLAGCGLIKSVVNISCILMQDFKTGHLTLTSPKTMFLSQAIGTALGCVIGPLSFFLFYNAFDIGNPNGEFKAPYALIYRNMAILSVQGVSALPQHCLQLCYGFFAFAVAINLVKDLSPEKIGKWMPLPMAMAVPFLIGGYFGIDMCIGSLVVFVWHKLNSKKAKVMVEDDDDYEDLYNDVNIGENFLQSARKNEDLGFKKEAELVAPPPESSRAALPVAVGEVKVEKEENVVSRVSGGADGFRDLGFRGNELGGRDPVKVESCDLVKVESCDPSGKVADLEQNGGDNVVNRGVIQRPNAAGVGGLGNVGNVENSGNDNLVRHGMVNGNSTGNNVGGVGVLGGGPSGGGGGGGGTVLFVGDLHWWTTDAELEAELSKYGTVKEVKFFDEKASGKSKGYCQAEFHEPAAATACKEGMNGHVFNGRACVVAFASPFTVKRMGEAQMNRNQQTAQAAPMNSQARRGPGDTAVKTGLNNNNATGGNFQGGGDNNRNFGRGNWGRGGPQGMGNRGPVGPMRNRPGGGIVGRGFMGNGGSGFGQGMGAGPPMMHPQTMMGQGFDPAFGGPMGRMGGYGGFPGAPNPPFSGMLPSFPPVGGGVGLPGVAPHVNPAFFGRGMPMNGMGMMPRACMEGPNMGMWSEPNMGGGWAGDEHGYRAGESSYGEEALSDHQYGEENRDRGAWPSNKEKDRGSERDWSGSSDRRHRDDREPSYERDKARDKNTGHDDDWQEERRHQDDRDVGRESVRERDRDHSRTRSRDRDRDLEKDRGSGRERDRHRDDRDRYGDHHRYKDREQEYDDEWDRGRSSRTHTKSRLSHEDDSRSRSRDIDYEKRRRLTSD